MSQSLEDRARKLAGGHYYCDDHWYSCPADPEGSADEQRGPECDCGLEERVQRILAALRATRQEGREEGLEGVDALVAAAEKVVISRRYIAGGFRPGAYGVPEADMRELYDAIVRLRQEEADTCDAGTCVRKKGHAGPHRDGPAVEADDG